MEVAPDGRARLPVLDIELAAGDEVVTYVARNLEPYRGFPSFMRSLPVILEQRPNARVLVYLTYPFVLSWSMLEAMAAGCLVVGSRTAPVEEVIRDGENGLLVDFFSPVEIAERVVEALAEPEHFAEVRARARQTVVEAYDLKRICLPGQLDLIAQMR